MSTAHRIEKFTLVADYHRHQGDLGSEASRLHRDRPAQPERDPTTNGTRLVSFAYAFHRQLPYGVPGAYRLLGNVLSLNKAPTPGLTRPQK